MKQNSQPPSVILPPLKTVDIIVSIISLMKGVVEVYFLIIIARSLTPGSQVSQPLTFEVTSSDLTFVVPILLLLYVMFSALLSFMQGKALASHMSAIRSGYFNALASTPYDVFQSRKQSDWEVSLSLLTEQGNIFLMRRLQFFAGLAAITVTLAALLVLSILVAISAVTVILILLVFAVPLRKRIASSSEARSRQGVVLGSSVRDLMSLRDEMKSPQVERSTLVLESQLVAESETFGSGFRYSQMTIALFMTGIFTISGIIAILSTKTGNVIGPEVGAAILLALRMLLYSQSIADLLSSKSRFQGTLREVNRLFMPEPRHSSAPLRSVCSASRALESAGDVLISITNGAVSQQSIDRNFLLSVPSLTIHEEDIVSVEGESGAGKSTLLRALFGLTTISGNPFFSDLYKPAFVGQNPVLLRTTLRANFTVFEPTLSEKKIWELLELTLLGRDSGIWPDGLDTRLDTSRMELSGGQIQRLSLARALSLGSNTLFLDEPVSALDDKTAATVLTGIREAFGKMTIIYTSHQDLGQILEPTQTVQIHAG